MQRTPGSRPPLLVAILPATGSKDSAAKVALVVNGAPAAVTGTLSADAVAVPLGAILGDLGLQAKWTGADGRALISGGADELTIWAGSSTAKGGDGEVTVSPAPRLVGGRLVVPLQPVARALGIQVEWQATLQTLHLQRTAVPVAEAAPVTPAAAPATAAPMQATPAQAAPAGVPVIFWSPATGVTAVRPTQATPAEALVQQTAPAEAPVEAAAPVQAAAPAPAQAPLAAEAPVEARAALPEAEKEPEAKDGVAAKPETEAEAETEMGAQVQAEAEVKTEAETKAETEAVAETPAAVAPVELATPPSQTPQWIAPAAPPPGPPKIQWARPAAAPAGPTPVNVSPMPPSCQDKATVETKQIREDTPDLVTDIQYPQVSDIVPAAAGKINATFADWAAKARYAGLQAVASGASGGSPIRPFQDYGRYDVGYNAYGIFSLYLDNYIFAGGAHGMTYRTPYTFDLSTGHDYALQELFRPSVNYVSLLSQEIKRQMDERGLTASLLQPFTAIKPDQKYYIRDGNLVIFFDLYEYFPYAWGFQEFPIPLTSLRPYLRPEFAAIPWGTPCP
ncbi:MAG: stalk domain-containing protein [Symbiobacteriia bacterium]